MVIAGAGGHGLEVLQLLLSQGILEEGIIFFDQNERLGDQVLGKYPLVKSMVEIEKCLSNDPRFCLGVGNPMHRKNLYTELLKVKGEYHPILSTSAIGTKQNPTYDIMSFSFVGPETKVGVGVLVNTRAHIHHECEVGVFTEISPGAILLGACEVGSLCRIGAGAVILPGVKIGNEVVVGAGAVVTKDYLEPKSVLKGVPAKINN